MDIRNQELEVLLKFIKGNVVDVGVGADKRYVPSIGIDKYPYGNFREHPDQDKSKADMRWNIHTLPFKDETIDTILSFHSIEHLEKPKEAILEWLRCLKKGGYLCLIIPDTRWTAGKDSCHLNEWKPEDFKKIVEDLKVVQCDTMNNNWSFDCVICKV